MTLYVLGAYALMLALGGMIGYAKTSSLISLLSGSLSALGLVASIYMIHKKRSAGYFCARLLTAMLTALFAYRFSLSHNWMPAGFMLILSLGVLGWLLFRGKK